MNNKLPTLLSIAGSDPMGGAGIQADIRAGARVGVHVLTAVTAVTAQNSQSLFEMGVVNANLLNSQLEAIKSDVSPDVVKIGLVGSSENFDVIADFLTSFKVKPFVVVDPILKLTVEEKSLFLKNEIKDFYINRLFPFADVAVPNVEELKSLLDEDSYFSDTSEMLEKLHLKSIIIKGGHNSGKEVKDTLITSDGSFYYSRNRIDCNNLHGSGCVFSSLLASFIAIGKNLKDSFFATCELMTQIIEESCSYQLGISNYGPLNINRYKF